MPVDPDAATYYSGQSSIPVTTDTARPPDHTSPSASMRNSMIASCPTSRPWLTR